MAFPGPRGPPEPSHNKRHYRQTGNRAASSHDGSAEFRGYAARFRRSGRCSGGGARPTAQVGAEGAGAKPIAVKTSIEDLAGELGLKLGDQNGLTIRRVKRGKRYSFHRANGTQIRHAGTIRRLHSMAVPPAYRESAIRPIRIRICRPSASTPPAGCNTATTPIGKRFASSARPTAWRGWSAPCRRSVARSRRICPATSRRASSRSRR